MDQRLDSTVVGPLDVLETSSKNSIARRKKQAIQNFRNSLIDIEILRKKQTQQLVRSLDMKKLPENLDITCESVLPLLSPKVRAVVKAFPFQAEEIVKRHGLDINEFNTMLRAAKANPFFRWRLRLLQDNK
jgi:Domain of unknown function (DUF4168)